MRFDTRGKSSPPSLNKKHDIFLLFSSRKIIALYGREDYSHFVLEKINFFSFFIFGGCYEGVGFSEKTN